MPSLPAIRRRVTSAPADLGDDHRTAVLMVLTELVTNVHDRGSGARRVRPAGNCATYGRQAC